MHQSSFASTRPFRQPRHGPPRTASSRISVWLALTTAWTYFFDSTGRATLVSVSSRSNFACETVTQQGTLIRPEVPVGQFISSDGSDAEFLR